MTKLLEQTLTTVKKLPDQQQDAIALMILEALEDEALLKAMQAADGDELLTKEQALAVLGQR
jgi:RelB Antitoxin alpha helical domain